MLPSNLGLAGPEVQPPPAPSRSPCRTRPSPFLLAWRSVQPLTPQPPPGTRTLADFRAYADPTPTFDAVLESLADQARAESIAMQETDPAWQTFVQATGLVEA